MSLLNGVIGEPVRGKDFILEEHENFLTDEGFKWHDYLHQWVASIIYKGYEITIFLYGNRLNLMMFSFVDENRTLVTDADYEFFDVPSFKLAYFNLLTALKTV